MNSEPATQGEQVDALRAPFPAAAVGKLPRSTCKACSDRNCQQHRKQRCDVCGAYMTTAHIHLDYVGHAGVTDRLLSVDPTWSWEPVAFDTNGAPLITTSGQRWVMWIRLTVCGVTRLGVGTCTGGFEPEKELIGDAIRNAAMRFGVALDLWSKEELESAHDESPPLTPSEALGGAEPSGVHAAVGSPNLAGPALAGPALPDQLKRLGARLTEIGVESSDRKGRLFFVNHALGKTGDQAVGSSKELTVGEAAMVLDIVDKVCTGAMALLFDEDSGHPYAHVYAEGEEPWPQEGEA